MLNLVDEFESWQKRDLSKLKIVYVWADGIYLKAGMADEKRCLLVIIGVDMTGKKHLLTLKEGFRESAESWFEAMSDLKKRGLNAPCLSRCGRRVGILGSITKSLVSDEKTALLATQNAEYFRQIAETRTSRSRLEIAGDLCGNESGNSGKIGKPIAQ